MQSSRTFAGSDEALDRRQEVSPVVVGLRINRGPRDVGGHRLHGVMVATGIAADGSREVLGLDVSKVKPESLAGYPD